MCLWEFIFREDVGFKSAAALEGDSSMDPSGVFLVRDLCIFFLFFKIFKLPYCCRSQLVTGFVLLSLSDCVFYRQNLVKTFSL